MMAILSENQWHFLYKSENKLEIYPIFIHIYKRYCVLCTKLPKIRNSVAYTIVENFIILSFSIFDFRYLYRGI